MDLQHIGGTVIVVSGAVSAVVGWVKIVWPRLKRAWSTRRSVLVMAALDRIEAATQAESVKGTDRGRKLDQLTREFVLFSSTVKAVVESDTTIATFEASPDGHLIDANRTYLQWTGKTLAELLRWGWINCVHPADQAQVRRDWESACRDVRQSVSIFRMLDADGEPFRVRATAKPIPDGPTCEKFAGVLHRLDP